MQADLHQQYSLPLPLFFPYHFHLPTIFTSLSTSPFSLCSLPLLPTPVPSSCKTPKHFLLLCVCSMAQWTKEPEYFVQCSGAWLSGASWFGPRLILADGHHELQNQQVKAVFFVYIYYLLLIFFSHPIYVLMFVLPNTNNQPPPETTYICIIPAIAVVVCSYVILLFLCSCSGGTFCYIQIII